MKKGEKDEAENKKEREDVREGTRGKRRNERECIQQEREGEERVRTML